MSTGYYVAFFSELEAIGYAQQEEFVKAKDTPMLIWVDDTSYRASDKERIPRTYVAHIGVLKLVVTRKVYHPEAWYIRCDGLIPEGCIPNSEPPKDAMGVYDIKKGMSADEAKAYAEKTLRDVVSEVLVCLEE